MNRRTYVAAVGTAAATGLAGCLSELGLDDGDDGGDDTDDSGNGNDDEHGAVLAVESYMAAAADEDLDAMSDAMHPHAPFDPADFADEAAADEDLEFTFDADELEDYEVELADEEYDADDVREVPYVEFWFEDVDLEAVLEGEEAALVDVAYETTEDGETAETEEAFIALTDDGEWTVLMAYEEPPEIPDGDPADDDAYRIVDELTYDAETEMVTVHFEESVDITVDEVIVYSTSLETDGSVYRPEDDDGEGLPVTRFSSAFDPDGDEIVVTVVEGDEEVVVHRETYES